MIIQFILGTCAILIIWHGNCSLIFSFDQKRPPSGFGNRIQEKMNYEEEREDESIQVVSFLHGRAVAGGLQ